MKISRAFPQFKGKTALFIVTGVHSAVLYGVRNGEIRKLGEFQVLYPTYSDRESFFESAGMGHIYGSGAVYERAKDETRKRFLRELKKNERFIISKEHVTHIYIFAPIYIARNVVGTLPNDMRSKVRRIFLGNYTHEHPFGLLGRIRQQKDAEEKILPVQEQARKILKITKDITKRKKANHS